MPTHFHTTTTVIQDDGDGTRANEDTATRNQVSNILQSNNYVFPFREKKSTTEASRGTKDGLDDRDGSEPIGATAQMVNRPSSQQTYQAENCKCTSTLKSTAH